MVYIFRVFLFASKAITLLRFYSIAMNSKYVLFFSTLVVSLYFFIVVRVRETARPQLSHNANEIIVYLHMNCVLYGTRSDINISSDFLTFHVFIFIWSYIGLNYEPLDIVLQINCLIIICIFANGLRALN